LPFAEAELSVLDGPAASKFVSLPGIADVVVRISADNAQTLESVGGTI
jgi:hypothetical protein